MVFTISLLFVMIFAMAILPLIGKMAGGSLLPASGAADRTEHTSVKRFAAMTKQNKEMTANMKLQINGFFAIEACNYPRVREMRSR